MAQPLARISPPERPLACHGDGDLVNWPQSESVHCPRALSRHWLLFGKQRSPPPPWRWGASGLVLGGDRIAHTQQRKVRRFIWKFVRRFSEEILNPGEIHLRAKQFGSSERSDGGSKHLMAPCFLLVLPLTANLAAPWQTLAQEWTKPWQYCPFPKGAALRVLCLGSAGSRKNRERLQEMEIHPTSFGKRDRDVRGGEAFGGRKPERNRAQTRSCHGLINLTRRCSKSRILRVARDASAVCVMAAIMRSTGSAWSPFLSHFTQRLALRRADASSKDKMRPSILAQRTAQVIFPGSSRVLPGASV